MLVNFCDSFIHIPQYCFINNEVIMIYPADNRVSANHYSDVIMSAMALQITGVSSACSTVCSGADQRKHQSSASQRTSNVSIWWRHNVREDVTYEEKLPIWVSQEIGNSTRQEKKWYSSKHNFNLSL